MKIPVARLWHKRGKLEYYTMLQLYKHFPTIQFEYHIVLDQPDYTDEWTDKIEELSNLSTAKCFWYTKEDMNSYLIDSNYANSEVIESIPNFIHFYHILINHYIRRVFRYDYALTIEYDVLFNSDDLTQVQYCLENKLPFGITEPANPNCDKALANNLIDLFQQNIVKYPNIGINAGFSGLNLKIFDTFMNPTAFDMLLKCFDFSGIYDSDGNEKIGWVRTIIDTQEQSFHSLINALSDDYQILDPNEYYVFPHWEGMEYLKKSKVINFIGHIKPDEMMQMIDSNLDI